MTIRSTLLLAAVLALAAPAHAQTAAPAKKDAAPGATPSATPKKDAPAVSPAKKELVAKLLQAQRPGIEGLARRIVEQPALQLVQQAGQVIQQRVPADKREAVFKDIQNEARKYADETYPKVRDKAVAVAPTAIGPILEQKLTEDELRQVLAIFESAAWKKYQGLGGEIEKAFLDKLAPEVNPLIEPGARSMQQAMARRLEGATAAAAPAASAPR